MHIFWISFDVIKFMLLSPFIMTVLFHVDFTIDNTESSFSTHQYFLLFSEPGWYNTPIRHAQFFFLFWISTY